MYVTKFQLLSFLYHDKDHHPDDNSIQNHNNISFPGMNKRDYHRINNSSHFQTALGIQMLYNKY